MILLAIACAVAAGYQITALLACIAHLARKHAKSSSCPAVSILKPVYGADPRFYEAIRTHAFIDYPEFEILFGARDPLDSAIPEIERFQREFPNLQVRLIRCTTDAPNGKAGTLAALAREARYPVWVVNDSDIRVEPDYLRRITAELAQPGVGLVTCLYRASGDSFPARFEALGIATDFAPSALVAPFVGVNEFGLGSTLAFRASEWQRAGGFDAIRDYLADDYQVGNRLSKLGLRVRMSAVAVSTHLGASSWQHVWSHQVRWARTVRLSRRLYFGLPVTNAMLWALLALLAGWWWAALGLLAIRMAVALVAGVGILHDPLVARHWSLVPARDLYSFAIWLAGALGNEVLWRGRRLKLDREGRIVDSV